MREFERGVASFSPAGFEDFEASRRRRLEAALRRCVRTASAGDWILGIFDANADLVAFDTSGPLVEDRAALTLLRMVPFPASPEPIAVSPSALGMAATIGPNHSAAVVVLFNEPSGDALSPAAAAIRSAMEEIVEELEPIYAEPRNVPPPVAGEGPEAFFLLNSSYEVEMEWFRNNGESNEFAHLVRPEERRLPLFFDQAVRRLTSAWNFSRPGTCVERVSHPLNGVTLRVVPMLRNELYVGAFFDFSREAKETEDAMPAFRISSREREVLHGLLEGRSIAEIAAALNLAESTVNDHVARMISKTHARNRIQMAATLLGWPAIKPQLTKNGRRNGRHNGHNGHAGYGGQGEHDDAGDQRARPSWRYHIGSGGPAHPADWLQ
jgi:DNA-binding CsgD family transcriptional regulator